MLIPRLQANVVVDQSGRALLTEYGLAPINFGPSFTESATAGVIGACRWLAPEIISTSSEDNNMESKPADVFSFAMLAVEVFTGRVPFEGRKNEVVMFFVSQGGRPEMPAHAQVVGLTAKVWTLLESCWEQDPERRPTMEEVVDGWQKLVGHSDDNITVTMCVHIALVIRTPSPVSFSIFS